MVARTASRSEASLLAGLSAALYQFDLDISLSLAHGDKRGEKLKSGAHDLIDAWLTRHFLKAAKTESISPVGIWVQQQQQQKQLLEIEPKEDDASTIIRNLEGDESDSISLDEVSPVLPSPEQPRKIAPLRSSVRTRSKVTVAGPAATSAFASVDLASSSQAAAASAPAEVSHCPCCSKIPVKPDFLRDFTWINADEHLELALLERAGIAKRGKPRTDAISHDYRSDTSLPDSGASPDLAVYLEREKAREQLKFAKYSRRAERVAMYRIIVDKDLSYLTQAGQDVFREKLEEQRATAARTRQLLA